MADTRAYMALRYLLLIPLLYGGLVWNSRLEYSDGVTKDGFCALSTLDIAGLSCVLGRLTTRPYKRLRVNGYSNRRVAYYCNSTATTQIELLKLSGDIASNPGPALRSSNTGSPCAGCEKTLRKNQNGVRCSGCNNTYHMKCSGMISKELRSYSIAKAPTWYCIRCSLPPLSDSFFESVTLGENQNKILSEPLDETWTDYDQISRKHRSNLKLGHINANSIGGFKLHEIRSWLISGRFDLLVISETKIDATFPNSMFHVDGFRFCRCDRKAGGGGLLIYVRSDICFIRVKQLQGLPSEVWSSFKTESIILKVRLGKTWITVVGIYRPPSIIKSQWSHELSSLFEATSTLTSTVLYAGDFNADLSQPDKPPTDGRTLLDLLDIFNLHCLITKPTRKTKTTQTTLDLILTNNKTKSVASGVVDTHISDHSLVYTILRSSAPRARSRKICFRSLKNFSQENFVRDMQFVPFHIIDLFDELDDKAYAFEQLFLGVINEHAPMKQTMIRGNQVPYMTEQWRKAIRHRHKLWKKFTCNRTDANYEAYKSQRNTCTSLRRKAIKQHFLRKSVETVNPREFWSTFRPFLHTTTKQANDIVLNENDKIINDKKEIAELFNDHFVRITDGVPMIRENDYGENYVNHPSIKAIHEHRGTGSTACFCFHSTSEAQVEKLLNELNVRKSPGHDMIPPRLIKESAAVVARPLTTIINYCIEHCCYPSSWKKGIVTPLFKKNDEHSKVNYRPVTVLPALNNIFERLLAGQLCEFYREILSDFISAYRKFHSCETSLLRLTEDWRMMRDRGELVAVVSMDLSKAFDVIQYPLLLSKLKAYGMDDTSCALLRNYLSGRSQKVKVGDTFSDWESVRRGVPQGSVLGPMLFNIFINDLFFHVKKAKLNAYADDHQVYYSHNDPAVLEECVSHDVRVANQWYQENGMLVNESKHQGLVLGETDFSFSFPVQETLEIFGMEIDKKLNFSSHISNVCKKINNQLHVMLRFRKLIPRGTLLKLYKAYILPHFYYCSAVWHFCCARDAEKLEALNKRILRFILGDYSSPYSSLLKKINTTSLANKRVQNFLILLYKSLFFPHFPAYMKNMFSLRSSFYDLRGNNILSLCKPRTTSFGLSSFSYFSAKQWNALPDCIRTSDFTEFKRNIQGMTFV